MVPKTWKKIITKKRFKKIFVSNISTVISKPFTRPHIELKVCRLLKTFKFSNGSKKEWTGPKRKVIPEDK